MRKKQVINAILHFPANDRALALFKERMQDFYITQVEKQLSRYDLTKEQKVEVVHLLAEEYRTKAKEENQ